MLNSLRKKFEKGEQAIGTFFCMSNVAVMECLGYTGLDYVIIDTEHGVFDTQPMSDLIKAAEHGGITPLVRIADVTHKEIQRAVDNGAGGLIVPCLRDIEDIRKLVDLAKFAPIGNRGFIKSRGCGFGNEPWAMGTLAEYMANSNEKVLVLPQCETVECLESIEEVVAIDGVDGIFIGPFDLSITMGIPAKFDKPEFKAAVDRILKACKAVGKPCFIFTNNAEESRRYLEAGFDAVANSIDSVIITEAYRSFVNKIRG